jgi:hypothetical protein
MSDINLPWLTAYLGFITLPIVALLRTSVGRQIATVAPLTHHHLFK